MKKHIKKIALITLMLSCAALASCGKSDDNNISDNATKTATDTWQNSEQNIDGFYNCIKCEEPWIRADFEIKYTENGYRAVFYVQYTTADIYETGELLYGERLDDNTYEFHNAYESYKVSENGGDTLHIEGTEINGDFVKGERKAYGEDDYMIPDMPHYEADKNVEEGIEIDSTLAYAVRLELGYDNDIRLTYNDLESITYLASFENPVTSVKGISLLKNLEELHLGKGYVTDISELSQLKHIRFIDISGCYITDIPDLSDCNELESLYLGGNLIEDISPLTDIQSLKYVNLDSNRIKRIESIKDLTNLMMLMIDNNCIVDYSTLKENQAIIDAINNGSQGSYEEAVMVENKANEITGALPDNLSELEIEIELYKYIMNNMVYDESERPAHCYGYSGLVEGRGVCGDYAQAFCLLASHVGLEVYECTSDTHAWNIVKIDGKYYHCDSLWDDDSVKWNYFNKSTSYIYNVPDHMHDLWRYPICEESMSVLEYCDGFDETGNRLNFDEKKRSIIYDKPCNSNESYECKKQIYRKPPKIHSIFE